MVESVTRAKNKLEPIVSDRLHEESEARRCAKAFELPAKLFAGQQDERRLRYL